MNEKTALQKRIFIIVGAYLIGSLFSSFSMLIQPTIVVFWWIGLILYGCAMIASFTNYQKYHTPIFLVLLLAGIFLALAMLTL